ncbi:MAG: hypothetical protein QXS68_03115 [Candidatus Methanomethylicaceae archaeon]
MPSVQLYEQAIQTVNAQLEGDDTITATHAVATSAQVRIRFGSVSLEALEVLTGKSIQSYGSAQGGNRANLLKVDALNFPYFGICGKAVGAEGGELHVFVPMVKIREGFTVSAEYGRFAIPEVTATAVPDPAIGDNIIWLIQYEQATNVSLPPTFPT